MTYEERCEANAEAQNEARQIEEHFEKLNKDAQRKKLLKKAGYFTVNDLLQKLQQLKDKGYGDEIVGSDFEHYQYCEYDEKEKYVVIC